jgi:preprotein translocase subunit SecA
VFYISLEDDLMRLFGGERISAMMETLKVDETIPLQFSMLSKSIENAQKRKEGMNFAARKSVLNYDDVMNKQRETIYAERNKVLDGEELKPKILKMIDGTIDSAVSAYLNDPIAENWDLKGLRDALLGFVCDKNDLRYTNDELNNLTELDVAEYLKEKAYKKYEEREKLFGSEIMREVERIVLLRNVDANWMDHIDAMDQLRQGIGLRAYGQHDPVVAYRNESFDMFEAMNNAIKEQTSKQVLTVMVRSNENIKREKVAEEANGDKPATVKGKGKVSLNAPCPCGSGLKYKRCCGKNN